MKILGKSVSCNFQAFYKEIAPKINASIRFEKAPFQAFGDYLLENGIARIRVDTSINRPHFEYTVAHEMTHALQDTELWPRTTRKLGLPENSAEAIVGSELGALVRDLDVEQRLGRLGVDSSCSNDIRYKNSKKNLENTLIPSDGTPMWVIWVIRYSYLFFTQTTNRWNRLKEPCQRRAPSVAEKGEEIIALLNKHGWGNPDEALASMIAIRDSLGLTMQQVIIEDRRTLNHY